MGAAGADWLVRPERAEEEQPDKAIALLGIARGATVADIGAGNGYMTWRLAERVGPTGKVFANDIQSEMLEMLRRNMQQRKLRNVETVLGTYDDPRLPPNSLDLVILVDVYHEFSEPQKMLRRIRESLKPDGRLVLLEYRAEDPAVPIRPEHKDDGGAGEDRTRARRLPRRSCPGRPAPAAHSDLPKNSLTCL
jgi:ubiquinone/menaquinone biosynthesis C-methylase UbiE